MKRKVLFVVLILCIGVPASVMLKFGIGALGFEKSILHQALIGGVVGGLSVLLAQRLGLLPGKRKE